MCGIVGTVNWGDRETLARMNAVQRHRGPDDSGLWERNLPDGGWVGLGNRRLAIIDLSPAGHMPMSNEDGSLWITYNGEVYNYRELRKGLEARGHAFRSNTDTEVILHLYERWGSDCVKQLNGMFAFAIWDSRLESLFLARDHFGIKPLYYVRKDGRFAFASEIKSLLQLPGCAPEVNLEELHRYLTFLWVPEPHTMFKGISKLPAGYYATYQEGKFQIQQYWDLTFPPENTEYSHDERGLIEETRDRFYGCVQSQMVSDVPLGAFLSAGLDSSSIVAMMARARPDPVRTYTIGFPASHSRGEVTLDDPAVAARTARHFGCEHKEIMVKPNVVDLLPRLVFHMDEPVADPAIITAYLVTHEARRSVTVLLSGIGGDEIFAGYRKYVGHYLARRYQRLPEFLRRNLIDRPVLSLPTGRGMAVKGYLRLAKKFVRSGSLNPEDRFLMDSTYLNDVEKRELYCADVWRQIQGMDPWQQHRALLDRVRHADFLNRMLYVDMKTFMVSLNLNYNDKMSMASSLEVRVPFLDWQFVQWVASNVPPELKLKGWRGKYLLREAVRPWLPPEVLRQRKAGFGAPVDRWLAVDLRDFVDDVLSEDAVRRRGYFDPGTVSRWIREHRSGWRDWAMQIWQLLTFELWLQAFLDKNPTDDGARQSVSAAGTGK